MQNEQAPATCPGDEPSKASSMTGKASNKMRLVNGSRGVVIAWDWALPSGGVDIDGDARASQCACSCKSSMLARPSQVDMHPPASQSEESDCVLQVDACTCACTLASSDGAGGGTTQCGSRQCGRRWEQAVWAGGGSRQCGSTEEVGAGSVGGGGGSRQCGSCVQLHQCASCVQFHDQRRGLRDYVTEPPVMPVDVAPGGGLRNQNGVPQLYPVVRFINTDKRGGTRVRLVRPEKFEKHIYLKGTCIRRQVPLATPETLNPNP